MRKETKSKQNSRVKGSRETETINYEKVNEKENEWKVNDKGKSMRKETKSIQNSRAKRS